MNISKSKVVFGTIVLFAGLVGFLTGCDYSTSRRPVAGIIPPSTSGTEQAIPEDTTTLPPSDGSDTTESPAASPTVEIPTPAHEEVSDSDDDGVTDDDVDRSIDREALPVFHGPIAPIHVDPPARIPEAERPLRRPLRLP